MKFVLLHGTGGNHDSNWFPWLKKQLEAEGHDVWVPDLPQPDHPSRERYNKYILNECPFAFDKELIVVGHSSGSVAILNLLSVLKRDQTINTAVLVGSFTQALTDEPGWEQLRGLFTTPFDFEEIKQRAFQYIFIHSKDDPYCPIEQAEYLNKKLNGEIHRFSEKGHFSLSLDPRFDRLPELLDIIHKKILK